MTTATKTMAPLDSARGERARKARLSEAHVLAAAIFGHYETSGELESAACSTAPVNPPTDQLLVRRRLRADFQKALILDTARALGFSAPGGPASGGPVQSRKGLTAEQLGRICTALRSRMQELGIPSPEETRAQDKPLAASADQYRRLYKVIDKVERLPHWGGRAHTLNFIQRQTGGRFRAWPARGLTRSQAAAIERGLDGILRHQKEGEQAHGDSAT